MAVASQDLLLFCALFVEVWRRIVEIYGDWFFAYKMSTKYCGDLRRRRTRAKTAQKHAESRLVRFPDSYAGSTYYANRSCVRYVHGDRNWVSCPNPGVRGFFKARLVPAKLRFVFGDTPGTTRGSARVKAADPGTQHEQRPRALPFFARPSRVAPPRGRSAWPAYTRAGRRARGRARTHVDYHIGWCPYTRTCVRS